MNRTYLYLLLGSVFLQPLAVHADALVNSAIEQEQEALQAQITAGINNGTLSGSDVQALQARQQALSGQASGGVAASPLPAGLATPAYPNPAAAGLNNPRFTPQGRGQTATGPDPFTYNTLGPDAYHSQKYQNPQYNVPAYPTTDPQPAGVNQQYSGPSAGAPYGAGYGQAPGAGGALPQVYVYHPSMSR